MQVAEQAANMIAMHLDTRQWAPLARLLQLLNLSIDYWPSNATYLATAGVAALVSGECSHREVGGRGSLETGSRD